MDYHDTACQHALAYTMSPLKSAIDYNRADGNLQDAESPPSHQAVVIELARKSYARCQYTQASKSMASAAQNKDSGHVALPQVIVLCLD